MFSNHQLESILAQWPIGRLPIRAIQPISGGLSGALIWKVDAAVDSAVSLGTHSQDVGWALKAWPVETSLNRLREIHDLVRQAAAKCDLLTEPALADDKCSIVHFQDRLWDCSPWVAGHPLPVDAATQSLENAGEAIARVHEALSNFTLPLGGSSKASGGPNMDSEPVFSGLQRADPPKESVKNAEQLAQITGVPRSIEHRLRRFPELSLALQPILRHPPTLDALSNQLIRQFPSSAGECHALAGILTVAVERLRESWTPTSKRIRQDLVEFAENSGEFPVHRVLRDVHRGHVFVESDQKTVKGVIDYDAVGFDAPSADIARFAGSFKCSESDTLRSTAAGYRRIRPLSNREYELAKTLMFANIIGGMANWVVWLIGEQKCFPCPAPVIRDRISHLIASNCRIC